MVMPWIIAAAGSGVSHLVTKGAERERAKQKLELTKKLANLTPEQAAAVDAIQQQEVDEMQRRVELGVGPFKPLPEQAAERAREARGAARTRQAEHREERMQRLAELTPAERDFIEQSPDKEAAIEEIAKRKARSEEARAVVAEIHEGGIESITLRGCFD